MKHPIHIDPNSQIDSNHLKSYERFNNLLQMMNKLHQVKKVRSTSKQLTWNKWHWNVFFFITDLLSCRYSSLSLPVVTDLYLFVLLVFINFFWIRHKFYFRREKHHIIQTKFLVISCSQNKLFYFINDCSIGYWSCWILNNFWSL